MISQIFYSTLCCLQCHFSQVFTLQLLLQIILFCASIAIKTRAKNPAKLCYITYRMSCKNKHPGLFRTVCSNFVVKYKNISYAFQDVVSTHFLKLNPYKQIFFVRPKVQDIFTVCFSASYKIFHCAMTGLFNIWCFDVA